MDSPTKKKESFMNIYFAIPVRKGVWNVTERVFEIASSDYHWGLYSQEDFSTALLAMKSSVPKAAKGPYLINVDDVDFLGE